MSEKLPGISGMHDVVPDYRVATYRQSHHWSRLLSLFWETASRYDFDFIDTPEVENVELFVRSVGESSDIVSKEMYTWRQSNRELCLRPEGSAAVARALMSVDATHNGPVRVWYRMPMFRHERPQFGRYRRHVQHGAEIIGIEGPTADVEVIKFLWDYLTGAGLRGFSLHLNSIGDGECRPAYVAELQRLLLERKEEYCRDCQLRMRVNPLRVFDCKVSADRQRNKGLPRIVDRLCQPCEEHFTAVKDGLSALGVPFTVDPDLVRGLDYYTRTAFEMILNEPLEHMSAVSGGGRYDGLYQQIGGKPTAAVGFGAGVERLLLALEHQGGLSATRPGPTVFMAATTPELTPAIYPLVDGLRAAGLSVGHEERSRRLGKALAQAANKGSSFAAVIALKEWETGHILVKDLRAATQEVVPVEEFVQYLKDRTE